MTIFLQIKFYPNHSRIPARRVNCTAQENSLHSMNFDFTSEDSVDDAYTGQY